MWEHLTLESTFDRLSTYGIDHGITQRYYFYANGAALARLVK